MKESRKKILFLTTMYPGPLRKSTPVCHYFTREWQKVGYDVLVIHYRSMFPRIYSIMARLFRKWAVKVIGNDNVETDKNQQIVFYKKENIPVYSIPIFKYIPHHAYSRSQITKQVTLLSDILCKNDFVPDIIISHFYNPQMPIVYELKKIYKKARTCVTFHEADASVIKKTFGNRYKKYFESIDVFGFRSKGILQNFEEMYGKMKNVFVCYSGIPEAYIEQQINRTYKSFSRFCFVGQLISLKKVSITIEALARAFPDKDFRFDIIGQGVEKENLVRKAEELGVEENVFFHGYIPRDSVQKIIMNSDCFVMVSKPEAFGLVYLEAMGKGCITIGTKLQGIDGVIIDGQNGFVCEADNTQNLVTLIKKIKRLSSEERKEISDNAILTAHKMTDKKMAEVYLEKVM